MDDIAGLNWTSQSHEPKSLKANYTPNAFAFAALKPTPPTSGRASPFASSPQPPSKPATPTNDSFSNLVSFSAGSTNKNLSLQEQQKRLADIKRQQQESKSKGLQETYAGGDETFWNTLGSGRSTPAPEAVKNGNTGLVAGEDDIFAAFNTSSQAKVHPEPNLAVRSLPIQPLDEDDDPFGLSEFTARTKAGAAPSHSGFDEEDVLGLLGQPVPDRPKPEPRLDTTPALSDAHPQDKAVAELVDMGFPPEKAKRALETTESGTDIQAAVGWLLNEAHSEARQRSQARNGNTSAAHETREGPAPSSRRGGTNRMDQRRMPDAPFDDLRRSDQPPAASTEKDPAQVAAELGNNFLKTAGSLWKQGTKKVQQAVQDFNSDSDSSQPKWLREHERVSRSEQRPQQRTDETGVARRRRRNSQTKAQEPCVTDEAMMLESARPTPPPRPIPKSRPEPRFESSADNSRDHSPAVPSRLRDAHSPQPVFSRQQPQKPSASPPIKAALSRQAIEDQAAQAYVSSARRRKPAATIPGHDLLEGATRSELPSKAAPETNPVQSVLRRSVQTPPVAARPPPAVRKVPSISAMSLKACHLHREKGNEFFKRGDYSSAHQSYSTSITHLPSTHPLLIVLLTNRALTGLKIGEPKTAIADSDAAIGIIGLSKGESETIDFANGESPKPMRDFYGKALMRKAEALEQMEKWADAASVWREAVEGNHGGAASMQGRLRAEKAANPVATKPKPQPARKPASLRRPATARNDSSNAAVTRLRAANAAAERADDEKFALSDSVDARLTAWKGGKADNLRALLGSLDMVLWPEAGWKKISMADLVLPGKVKIQYMKGISKVHPDKIPTDATTEQRMIAGAVFSTLNEAWDKFKTENGL